MVARIASGPAKPDVSCHGACPAWCDGDHDLSGDETAVRHCRAVRHSGSGPSIGVDLVADEPLDLPGRITATRLLIHSDDSGPLTEPWFVAMPMDAARLRVLLAALNDALGLIESGRAMPAAG